jgi:pyruvate/2-oxoglutarate dehydrogenase complex dihydrolipoamide dehydrogenase (E3) component
LTDEKGSKEVVTAQNIVIATGGRPTSPGIPGEEHAISSDDIFWKK